ncbi:hypothetical protein C8Q72DRAFT_889403 [Fomitopsis betulina]|nr:hypothetical protein C8Q72DRAFT_889403 [Fomitopsis betulina]
MIDELVELLETFHDQAKTTDHDALDVAEEALWGLSADDLNLEDNDDEVIGEWDVSHLNDDNVEGWVDQLNGLTEEEITELQATTCPAKFVLTKLHKFAFTVINLTTKLVPTWYRTVEQLNLPQDSMPCDVHTRWNSTYGMLSFAFELSNKEWKIVGHLCKVLKMFSDTTLFFSRDTPNLAMVIPVMDVLDEHLTNTSHDLDFYPSIHAAVGLAKKTQNLYYSKTDDLNVYHIMMILHPRHKLTYFMLKECVMSDREVQHFKAAKWQETWIQAVEALICDKYTDWLLRHGEQKVDTDASEEQANGKQGSTKKSKNMFDNLPALAPPKPMKVANEIGTYLADDV